MLKKVGVAIGKFIDMLGSYWKDCPRKDKDKVYKILVSDYIAVHDFGTSAAPLKAAGSTFKVRMVSRQLLPHACDRWC